MRPARPWFVPAHSQAEERTPACGTTKLSRESGGPDQGELLGVNRGSGPPAFLWDEKALPMYLYRPDFF